MPAPREEQPAIVAVTSQPPMPLPTGPMAVVTTQPAEPNSLPVANKEAAAPHRARRLLTTAGLKPAPAANGNGSPNPVSHITLPQRHKPPPRTISCSTTR